MGRILSCRSVQELSGKIPFFSSGRHLHQNKILILFFIFLSFFVLLVTVNRLCRIQIIFKSRIDVFQFKVVFWNEKQMLGMMFWWVTLDGQLEILPGYFKILGMIGDINILNPSCFLSVSHSGSCCSTASEALNG